MASKNDSAVLVSQPPRPKLDDLLAHMQELHDEHKADPWFESITIESLRAAS